MKKKLFLLPIALVFAYFMLSSNADAPAGMHSIDGTGATGAPGCGGTSCHASSTSIITTAGLDSIAPTSTTPPVLHKCYIPGQTYTAIIYGVNTSFTSSYPKYGFQLTIVSGSSSSPAMAGTFSSSLPASCVNSVIGSGTIHYIEQSAALSPISGTGGFLTVYGDTVRWTAPAAGTGTIRVRGVICAVNNDGAATGDAYSDTGSVLTEFDLPVITGTTTLCVGSTSALSNTLTGGTWSSGNPSVATISGSGTVYGVSAGTSIITYTTSLGSVTTTVTVSAAPSVGTISGATMVCVGTPVSLTESMTGGTWSSGTTSVATISSSGTVYGVSPGTTIISYGIVGSCGTAYATQTITVSSGIVTGTISGATSVCAGLTATMSETVSLGTWSSGSASVATVNSAGVVTGVAAGTTTISYAVTTGCGTGYATHSITVVASPSPGTISGAPSLFCTQATALLSETVAGGSWSSSNPSVANVDIYGNVTGYSAGSTVISYSVSNSSGCTVAATDPITITAGPTATITASGATSFCYGDVVLNANLGYGLSWQWYDNTTLIAGATSSSYAAAATGPYIVKVTDATGCSTASSAIDVTVLSVPVITATGPSTFCSGSNLLLSVSAVGGGYTSVYQWKRNTINIPGATNTSYAATTTGSYTCFENISGGCTGTTPAVTVNVWATPTPEITFNGTDLSTTTTFASYQWQLNGVNIPGATNQNYPPSTSGNYTVVTTNMAGGCTGISQEYTMFPMSVGTTATNGDWQIFPNPANNVLNITNPSAANSVVDYFVTDIPGRSVLQGKLSTGNNQVDISKLATGSYVLKITGENGFTKNEMFIKQ